MFLKIFCSTVCWFAKGFPSQEAVLFGRPWRGKVWERNPCSIKHEVSLEFTYLVVVHRHFPAAYEGKKVSVCSDVSHYAF